MKSQRVLFLTDQCEAAASRFARLGHVEHEYSITFKDRQTIQEGAATAFDLIVLEVGTASMAATFKNCRRLRRNTQAPILIVSPHDSEECALAAYRAGADDYIVEPLSVELWHAKLQAWLRWAAPVFSFPLAHAVNTLSAM